MKFYREVIESTVFRVRKSESGNILFGIKNGCIEIWGSDLVCEWSDGERVSLELHQGRTKIVIGSIAEKHVPVFEAFRDKAFFL